MAIFNSGTYINEIEKKSYPIGTPSKGYSANGMVIPYQSSFLNANPEAVVAPPPAQQYQQPTQNYQQPTQPVQQPTQPTRSKYINPATGAYFTPQEYANYVAEKIPKGDIPKTATDAIMDPNRSTTDLEGDARNLNNARNDLAVGETSMFAGSDKTAGGEQIIYSPAEKEAIRKASAGIYDPALNDVFARLKDKKAAEEKEARKQEQIFATNENIRQYNATTAINKKSSEVASLGILRGQDGYVNPSEYIQKAYDFERNGNGTMEQFLNKYPPVNYINPGDIEKLPTFLRPKAATQSQTSIDSTIWEWLLTPEAQGLDDTEKARQIAEFGGGNPNKFGIYP